MLCFCCTFCKEICNQCFPNKTPSGLKESQRNSKINLSELLKQVQRKLEGWICRDDDMGNESSYNGIMQGLSLSLCLYSAYNQGTWPSWLPLGTAAIQITNKNNGIKSEYVIQAILPQGKHNPQLPEGKVGRKEFSPWAGHPMAAVPEVSWILLWNVLSCTPHCERQVTELDGQAIWSTMAIPMIP